MDDGKIYGALVGLLLLVGWCTMTVTWEPPGAKSSVEAHGFTDVQVTGWAPFACGRDDSVCRSFTAKKPDGSAVSGVVGCGLVFKLCTVRF